MKEQSIKIKTIKERILESLLNCPKTSTQLLQDLGYSNKRHGNISKPLDQLKIDGLIIDDRIKSPNINDSATSWSIVQTLENFRHIRKYPDLLPVLQKKDFVLEIIAENMRIPITNSVTVFQNGKKRFIGGKEELHSLREEDKRKFKEMLRLSPEFFKFHLYRNDNSVMAGSGFEKLTETLRRIDELHDIPTRCLGWGHLYYYFMAFKACVLMDALYENSSEDAENYLIEIEENIKVVTKQRYNPT